VLDWPALARAWLAATLTLGLLPLGALPALMTLGLTGGGWGELSAPGWRVLLAVLPLFALAMLPLTVAAAEPRIVVSLPPLHSLVVGVLADYGSFDEAFLGLAIVGAIGFIVSYYYVENF
jgi:hypothetical protein